MYAFDYARPTSVAEAAGILASDGDAKLLAGGHTLIPTLKARLANPSQLVDLSAVSELRSISAKDGMVTIGAMVRHGEVAENKEVAAAFPALAALAHLIGDPAVRHRGTIGGSVANNDPAADYPAAVLATNATITTDKRSIEGDAFFQGLFTTALDEGEMITGVAFPVPKRGAYVKFRNPASRYAMVGVFVAEGAGGIRVAVTGAGNAGVFRWSEAEAALASDFSVAAIEALAKVPVDGMNSDIHASAEYRAHLVKVMTKRAVAEILG